MWLASTLQLVNGTIYYDGFWGYILENCSASILVIVLDDFTNYLGNKLKLNVFIALEVIIGSLWKKILLSISVRDAVKQCHLLSNLHDLLY